jgi:spermidine synthase
VQLVRPERRHELTSYYCEGSGFYLAVLNHPKRRAGEPMRFGVVGLGIGVIAAYGGKGDSVRFYELSPAVDRIARSHFSFLADSAAETEVVLGDARLSLERELASGQRQAFDIIAVDAFSSDAVPRHLVTREAIALYLEHLAPGGFLCVQISNRYLDLKPLLKALADAHGLASALVMAAQPKSEVWRADSTWVVLSRDPQAFTTEGWKGKTTPWPTDMKVMEPWTDDFGGLFSIIRW